MPQIIVVADPRSDRAAGREDSVMFTERVSVHDFESQHFQHQLVERLGWAVGDADAVERAANEGDDAGYWDDEPSPAEGHEVPEAVPPDAAQPEAMAPDPEASRHGRLSAVGPVS